MESYWHAFKVPGETAHLANFHLFISSTVIISAVVERNSKSAEDV